MRRRRGESASPVGTAATAIWSRSITATGCRPATATSRRSASTSATKFEPGQVIGRIGSTGLDDFASRPIKPDLICLVGEAEDLVLVDIGDEDGQGVGDGEELLLVCARPLLGKLALGNVDMRADHGDRLARVVTLDFRHSADPPHVAVARANDAVLGSVVRGAAGDRAEEALDRAGAIVRVEALHPGLVRLDPCFRGQPVKPDIFWRSVSQEIVAHVDPHAADAADLLHPRQRELPLTEPLKDVLTIGGVAERDPIPSPSGKARTS